MDFSTINWLAVIVAAVAAWLFGALWYTALSGPWRTAARIDPATASKSILPFVFSFIALIIMATVASLLLGALTGGEPVLVAGLVFGFVFWLGFVLTTLATNQRYQGFGWTLTIIDLGHWLGVLLIIGAVLGWFGAPVLPE